jgi:prepilin-type N-terminal cleavage/methylation domain-containing protein
MSGEGMGVLRHLHITFHRALVLTDGFRKQDERRREPLSSRSDGFTLMELAIVILILGILVGIAVGVMFVARTAAWNNTAKANEQIGNQSMDNIWMYFMGQVPVGTIPTQRFTRYYDGYSIWAQSMSRYERKINWVDIRRGANNRLFQYGVWKNNALLPNTRSGTTYYYDWSKVYGRIGVYRGWRNTATNRWTNSTTTGVGAYGEVTVIVLTEGTNKAYWTSYSMGQVIGSGSFTWAPGTGNTTGFGPY